jgi:hypothetical protein
MFNHCIRFLTRISRFAAHPTGFISLWRDSKSLKNTLRAQSPPFIFNRLRHDFSRAISKPGFHHRLLHIAILGGASLCITAVVYSGEDNKKACDHDAKKGAKNRRQDTGPTLGACIHQLPIRSLRNS